MVAYMATQPCLISQAGAAGGRLVAVRAQAQGIPDVDGALDAKLALDDREGEAVWSAQLLRALLVTPQWTGVLMTLATAWRLMAGSAFGCISCSPGVVTGPSDSMAVALVMAAQLVVHRRVDRQFVRAQEGRDPRPAAGRHLDDVREAAPHDGELGPGEGLEKPSNL